MSVPVNSNPCLLFAYSTQRKDVGCVSDKWGVSGRPAPATGTSSVRKSSSGGNKSQEQRSLAMRFRVEGPGFWVGGVLAALVVALVLLLLVVAVVVVLVLVLVVSVEVLVVVVVVVVSAAAAAAAWGPFPLSLWSVCDTCCRQKPHPRQKVTSAITHLGSCQASQQFPALSASPFQDKGP